uniref:Uncharacterized protein n=1 Tax=Avena sativa TaxID=4498 RepID=A0ACD6AGD9_AVESA
MRLIQQGLPHHQQAPKTNLEGVGTMEKYIEMKTKQIENAQTGSRIVDEFSIKNCIARLGTMPLSQEKVKALSVFKIAENRELFICTDPDTALLWLRAEIA